jgi:GxxExxY protein
MKPPINAEEHGLILEGQTSAILGAAMEVLNTLGHGLLEKTYENALCVELGLRGIAFQQQRCFQVMYKAALVGEYVPDLIVGEIVVDAKTIERITDHELGQMINYLKITRLPVGLIVNFKRARLEWKRVVNTARIAGEAEMAEIDRG